MAGSWGTLLISRFFPSLAAQEWRHAADKDEDSWRQDAIMGKESSKWRDGPQEREKDQSQGIGITVLLFLVTVLQEMSHEL